MNQPIFHLPGQLITDCCKTTLPEPSDEVLRQKLQGLVPDFTVKLAWRSDEWYRLGGVVDADGLRVAKDLVEWVERTFLECGQNLQTLIDYAIEEKFVATKQTGKTLYFVIETGNTAQDFVLIEIDEIHEVTDRLLVNEKHLPEDLEDLIDPLKPCCVDAVCLGSARYVYKRKTDVALFMEVVSERYADEHPVHRFMDDWNRSSAGQSHHFSHYWLIRPYRHTGRFGEQVVNVELIDTTKNPLPHLEDFTGKKGTALSNVLARFDKQAGYPFAWFFYMLKGKFVSTHSAEAVFRDIAGDFAYLPKRDEAVLRDWIASPYNV